MVIACQNIGPLIPGATLKKAASLFLVYAAPLLKKEGDAGSLALVADVQYPLLVHGTGTGAGFSAYDNPVHADKVEMREWTKERF